MSFESPQEAASAELARSQSVLSERLFSVGQPQLASTLALIKQQLGNGGMPESISSVYGQARNELNTGYDNASRNTGSLLQQQALQSGQRFLPGQVQGAFSNYSESLEHDRSQAMRRLQFGEAQSGLTQYNSLLNLLGQGSGAALNLARGFSGNQASAIGGLSQSSPGAGALGGAAAGASVGTSIYPGWGTLIGAGVGAAGGYLSGGG